MNKVILMGRLTKDPEIRYSQNAEPVCISKFTLAVDRRFKKEGEPDADFILCVAFRRTAEMMERHVKKGMMISVCGSLTVRSFDDSTGQRKWITEVTVDEISFAESKAAFEARMQRGGGDNYNPAHIPPSAGSSPTPEPEGFKAITQSIDEDDDLPF
ncbi:MAG: single-stranded DNA-binding protein [Defluviitaleaceae bacterium]|nr:single-stranded DNA-binding protein [Defluviitaleaceae bacterium]